MSSQIGQASRDTGHCETRRSTRVSHLLGVGCPPAISWLIIAFVVWVAVNGQSWRAFSHVREKLLEGMPPLIAHFTSVTGKIGSIGIGASVGHAAPNAISSRPLATAALPVSDIDFLMGASARLDMAAPDGFIPDDEFFPAVANEPASVFHGAVPHWFGVGRSGESKVSDYLSGRKRFESGHSITSFRKPIVAGPAAHNAPFFEAEVANAHLVSARKRSNERDSTVVVLTPTWAFGIALNDNGVLNSAGRFVLRAGRFLGRFIWHNGSGFTVCKWRVSDANLIPAAIINPAICAVNSD